MFKHDLFISYAHLDNESLYESDQGWIDLLHKRLEIRLAQLLGEQPKIWRDLKLSGNDIFGETLLVELAQAAIIVSVFSPRYVKSDWCLKELLAFQQQAEAGVGLHIDTKSRIFKVVKTPVGRDDFPQAVRGLLGYEFFGIDQATRQLREFDYDAGPNRDKRYWEKLEDLAQDIKDLVARLRNQSPAIMKPDGKTIYLAETTSDLNEDRDRIRRELQLNGHQVLPDKPLSLDHRLRDEVNNHLAASHLAVHLIGKKYGIIPEAEAASVIELQRELASAHLGAPGFSQIIWMPQGLSSTDARQQKFIDQLANHLNLPRTVALLQSRLEDLKSFIQEKLNPPPPPEPRKAVTDNGNHDPALVYLLYDKPDDDTAKPIEDCLYDHGFELFSLTDNDDPSMHRQYLRECDAVLTVCGNTTDGWLQMKRLDLLKLSGSGREKPMPTTGFYLSAPQTSGKARFRTQNGVVIRNFGEFTRESLNPFIAAIEKARGARS